MKDIFQPRSEPAKSIYEAFQLEASMRDGRTIDEWQAAERTAVHREAAIQANRLGLQEPTMEQVELAERHAYGSADYGAKWASAVVRAMQI